MNNYQTYVRVSKSTLEYALRKMTQLYSFTGLKVIQKNSYPKQSQSTDINSIQKPLDQNEKELPKQTSKNVDNEKITQTETKIEN